MKAKYIALVIAAISFSAAAQEQTNYVQIGAIHINYIDPLVTFDNGMLALTAGHKFDPHFSIEAMAAADRTSATETWGSANVTAKVSNSYGVYVKAQSAPSHGFSIYGKAGLTRETVTSSAFVPGFQSSAWSPTTAAAYGAGVQFDTSPNTFVSLDYMSYYKKNSVKFEGPSMNFGIKF